jgi:MFS family permease
VFVALASGTPYVYSVYAPQLVKNSGLSASDSGKLSLALSVGGSIGGFPAGVFIDWAGPAIATAVGSIITFVSFFVLHSGFVNQTKNVPVLMAALAASSLASVLCFYATVNCITANFPHHRGTAGALPVSSYALASLMYSAMAVNLFEDNIAGLLKFFSFFSPIVCLCGSFFLVIVDKKKKKQQQQQDRPLSSDIENGPTSENEPLLRRNSSFIEQANEIRKQYQHKLSLWGIGRTPSSSSLASPNGSFGSFSNVQRPRFQRRLDSDAIYVAVEDVPIFVKYGSPIWNHHIFKKIFSRLYIKFYIILAALQSIGQFYIYSVGFLVVTLEGSQHSTSLTAAEAQALQVSVVSLASFLGRLSSGPISDVVVKKLRAQRVWCIFFASILLSFGQYLTTRISNLEHLIYPSFVNGFAFGFTFGSFPAVIADSFGTEGFSTLWGFLTTGAMFLLLALTQNLAFTINKHSDDTGVCNLGSGCYREAFQITQYGCLVVSVLVMITIYWNHKLRVRRP